MTKKFLIGCKSPMYFSREFSLEITVQISSQSVKISSSYAASQIEKYDFEKNALKF